MKTSTETPDFGAIEGRQRATRASGDYHVIAAIIVPVAERWCDSVAGTVWDLVAGATIQFDDWEASAGTSGGLALSRLFRAGHEGPSATSTNAAGTSVTQAAPELADPLTARERQVALLLARSLTNRQIGDELVISAATAERHVVNVFNKLGFHSRSQLAAWVLEHGLAHHRAPRAKNTHPVQDR
ncbi:MAG: response regulator transcription factor [Chloroflexi bacterium]|nr:response regulator transcription factor [Chloroflexota bacterium]